MGFEAKVCAYWTKGHEDNVMCVYISIDGLNAISGDTESKVRYWDFQNYVQLFLFEGHNG